MEPERAPMRPKNMTRTRLVVAGLILILGVGTPLAHPAQAGPRYPGTGDRITVVLTSDRQYNSAVAWYDAHNRMRRQSDVPLNRFDKRTGLWSGSLVYTSRVRHQKIDTVLQSDGRFARCAVWINKTKVREKTARGPRYATAYCH
ncbi:hypothetical protein [Gordonia sp. OPL2]|uniref:hypothetical protein n=1 Tax=Gordonia sp. OPL2 TaxID=2486274 RepID=UPI0016565888|nr:hypothetical protein [Gordonia sp. OPL2]RPA12210.1 hypothetical protein EEB19_07805 [Gordonia sp. OPL2]